jgi:methyltransferase (TIGR00027 family)
MKQNQTSQSAQGMAAIRALETEKPAGARVCCDPLARRFLDPGAFYIHRILAETIERRAPGFIGFIVSRCRYIDDVLEECLGSGFQQVVILGAGLDSRAYRFDPPGGAVRFFEVDSPATQAAKIARVRKVLHAVPGHVTYVPIDFNEATLDKLVESGYSRSSKTLFIWEGVVAYLQPEAVDATLAWVRANSASGSLIVFDTIDAAALAADRPRFEVKLSRFTRHFSGEGLVFGIDRERIADFMARRGFTSVTSLRAEDFKRRYFRPDQPPRPVADIYSIVKAMVP